MQINEALKKAGIQGELIGNEKTDFLGLNLCNRPTKKERIVSYVTSDKYYDAVLSNESVVVLFVPKGIDVYNEILLGRTGCVVQFEHPESDFYKLHEFLVKDNADDKSLGKPIIGSNCNIHPTAFIEDGVRLGNNVRIGAFTIVKKGTVVGNNVTIGNNSVIGSEGFQILEDENENHIHVSHIGGVIIEDDVYIGDCTCVCNSLFEGGTFIGKNAKIDNLVHIAHNCYIGANAVVTAGVILCGSSTILENAWIGPNSSVLNKVIIGNKAKIGLGSVVTRSIPDGMLAYGVPAKTKE